MNEGPEKIKNVSPEGAGGEGKEERGIKHQEIAELREPIQNILLRLRKRIDGGEYGLLVGDDASGRVPVWVFYNFLKELYKERGLPPPHVRYFAGGSLFLFDEEEKTEDIKIVLKEAMRRAGIKTTRALIVTDTINRGNALSPITTAVKEVGLTFDIATIGLITLHPTSAEETEEKERAVGGRLGGEVFSGMQREPGIYGRKALSGVVKNYEDVFAKPGGLIPNSPNLPRGWHREVREGIREARADAKILAHELVRWYQKDEAKSK